MRVGLKTYSFGYDTALVLVLILILKM